MPCAERGDSPPRELSGEDEISLLLEGLAVWVVTNTVDVVVDVLSDPDTVLVTVRVTAEQACDNIGVPVPAAAVLTG